MGVHTSKNSRPGSKVPARATPRFASIYHSWLGYIGFGATFIDALITMTMYVGFFEDSSTATFLALQCIMYVIYHVLFWTNSAWYSVTFASRRYLKIDMKEEIPIMTESATFDLVTERDSKFHNDQKHFSFVLKCRTVILLFLAIWLGIQGTANPSPDFNSLPAVYDAVASKQHEIIRGFHLLILAVAGGCAAIMLDTQACLFHTTMCALNDDLVSGRFGGDGKGLRNPAESSSQPGQLTDVITDKGTSNSIYARQLLHAGK